MSYRAYLSRVTIEPVVFLYVFAIFAEYVVVEDLIYVSKCVQHLNMTDTATLHVCTQDLKLHKNSSTFGNDTADIISKETNNAMLIYNGILYLCSIISSFVAATYADRHSKLLPILVPVLGSTAVQLIIITSLIVSPWTLLFTNEGVVIVYVCSLVSGLTGGTSTLLSSCFAHVSERCSSQARTSRITIVEACLFAGGFFGLLYAGSILRANPSSLDRYFLNFGIYLSIHMLLGAYLLIRAGLFPSPQRPPQWASFCFMMTSVLHTIFRRREQRSIILLILGTFIFVSYWNTALTTTLFVFTKNLPLNWPSWKYSYYSSAKFALCGTFLLLLPLVQYLLANRLHRRPLSDGIIITMGLISRGLSIILIGLATNTTLMIIALAVIVLAEYPIPAIRSLISKIVEPNEKAQVFAFMSTLQSICFFTGGMMFPAFYTLLLDHKKASGGGNVFNGPGLQYIVLGLVQLVCIVSFL